MTLTSAWRYRLFQVLVVLLFALVAVIPSLIKHNGTAAAFTQVYLTYTLGMLGALMGFVTLWLACGSLAREVEDCQMQMVATKPIARWQIWLGKWLGIVCLNAILLFLAAGGIYGLLLWKANQLSEKEQAVLKNQILVARGSLKEKPTDVSADVERIYQQRLKEHPEARAQASVVRQAVIDDVMAMQQVVPPDHQRIWKLALGPRKYTLKDQPLRLRVRFHAASPSSTGTFRTVWLISDSQGRQLWRSTQELTSDHFHEIEIPPNLFGDDGVMVITARNRSETTLLFTLEEGLELLYRDGSFGLNFFRGVGVLLCRLAVLAALGLAAASFLSFPVASFFTVSVLLLFFSTNLFQEVVYEGTIGEVGHEHGQEQPLNIFIQAADKVLIPMFRATLAFKNSMAAVSPVDALSSGRSISWGEFFLAVLKNVIFLSGLLGLFGIFMFNRRELATAQSKQ